MWITLRQLDFLQLHALAFRISLLSSNAPIRREEGDEGASTMTNCWRILSRARTYGVKVMFQ